MIKVVSKGLVKKGKLEQALALYTELVEKTRRELGCISYELFQDTENPHILTIIETWENKGCLESHFNAEHFVRLVPELKKLREGNAELNVYTKIL